MEIVRYQDSFEKAWDRFIDKDSINGTLLQTRRFLNYHEEGRFEDYSLLVMKGSNIVAVIPGNCVIEEGKKIFYSHQGSTFGGIIVGRQYKKISDIEVIIDLFEQYLENQSFNEIILKQTSELYSDDEFEMLYYMLFTRGYQSMLEVGYYIDLKKIIPDAIEKSFSESRRRHYKSSLKNSLSFRELKSEEEIRSFYQILLNNMTKFNTKPIHTCKELLDLYQNRISESIRFFGVFEQKEIVAGSMVFDFHQKVFHTQYLASNQEKLQLYPNEFLYYSLIEKAIMDKYPYISFGTATLEHGKVLNKSLAQFKEGFGTKQYVNYTFCKNSPFDS
ncbi:MAG: GNAT family N-acetyltransferase [Lachnospiraceae bacterium]|nr:GNAT family N-acetyltransferase [Lachnospiraceae bacterium]